MHSIAKKTAASFQPSCRSRRSGPRTMPAEACLHSRLLSRPVVASSALGSGGSRTHGMTLIELMVAMTLGMLVLGVVAVIFSGTSGNRASLERGGRLAENAAYAVEVLGDEIRMAGFFAETNLTGVTWQVPDP